MAHQISYQKSPAYAGLFYAANLTPTRVLFKANTGTLSHLRKAQERSFKVLAVMRRRSQNGH